MVKPPELPKSLFTRGGKDPFFPDSARTPQPVKAEGVAAQVVIKRNPYEYLRITGMIRSRRPVVSFNTVSMAKGDRGVEVQVVMPGADNVPRPAKLRVSCIDIGDNWALVQVEGEPTPQRIYFKE